MFEVPIHTHNVHINIYWYIYILLLWKGKLYMMITRWVYAMKQL